MASHRKTRNVRRGALPSEFLRDAILRLRSYRGRTRLALPVGPRAIFAGPANSVVTAHRLRIGTVRPRAGLRQPIDFRRLTNLYGREHFGKATSRFERARRGELHRW